MTIILLLIAFIWVYFIGKSLNDTQRTVNEGFRTITEYHANELLNLVQKVKLNETE